jgi:hypothetical protein
MSHLENGGARRKPHQYHVILRGFATPQTRFPNGSATRTLQVREVYSPVFKNTRFYYAVSNPVVPEDAALLKPFGKRACCVADPGDTNGSRYSSRLAIPFAKRLINSASLSTTGLCKVGSNNRNSTLYFSRSFTLPLAWV